MDPACNTLDFETPLKIYILLLCSSESAYLRDVAAAAGHHGQQVLGVHSAQAQAAAAAAAAASAADHPNKRPRLGYGAQPPPPHAQPLTHPGLHAAAAQAAHHAAAAYVHGGPASAHPGLAVAGPGPSSSAATLEPLRIDTAVKVRSRDYRLEMK